MSNTTSQYLRIIFTLLLIFTGAISQDFVYTEIGIEGNDDPINISDFPVKLDSLRLSIYTNPPAVGLYLNNQNFGMTPFEHKLVYYQQNLRVDLQQPGYAPFTFILDQPDREYHISCSMVPEFRLEEMRKFINDAYIQKYREPLLALAFFASVGAGVFERRLDREWGDYNYLLDAGHDPTKNKINRYSALTKQLVYSIPLLVSIPLLTNFAKNPNPMKNRGEKYHYARFENKVRRKNAKYNFALCILSASILESLKESTKSRESTLLWDLGFEDATLYQTVDFTSKVLLSLGIIELIDLGLLKLNKPIISDYIEISIL